MRVLFVSHEVSPYAKVGGLADVAGSLPQALRRLGHEVRVVMPAYRMVREDPRWAFETAGEPFEVPINPVWSVEAQGYSSGEVTLLRAGKWFDETASCQTVYLPGEDRHIAFAKAVLAHCERANWMPDIVHTQDWHTGLIPVFMRESHPEAWAGAASVHTIHNLAYQGVFPPETVAKAGLPWELWDMHRLETWGQFNFLKAACAYADQVNTVSPRYAKEIQTAEYGCTLEGLMRHLDAEGRLKGILNGIDVEEFDPSRDPHIAAHYNSESLGGKSVCRVGLLDELGWSDSGIPVAGIVTRISQQKGLDLVLAAADELAELPMHLVVLGLGEPWLCDRFEALQKERPDRFRFVQEFDAPLAQRIYAGADFFLMPSAFEPCGLGQMIAMRYGAIPVVRKTGGLADTVEDGKTGFVFDEKSPEALHWACERAAAAWKGGERWREMVRTAMAEDFSWGASAREYESMYEEALLKRLRAERGMHSADRGAE